MTKPIRRVCSLTFLSFFIAAAVPSTAVACDLCSIYIADQNSSTTSGEFGLTLAEQFTGFHRLQNDGKFVPNSANQSMTSSITQITPRYNVSSDVSALVSIPLISRQFDRPEGDGQVHSGSESGLGDISAIAVFTPYRNNSAAGFFHWDLQAGVKIPTGSTDRLREETKEEVEDSEAPESHFEIDHGQNNQTLISNVSHSGHVEEIPSGVHGHDITLGTGSFDYILGTSFSFQSDLLIWRAGLQYIIRTEGDFNYRFQNDLQWDASFGHYIVTEHNHTLALKGVITGEYKGMDVFEGNRAADTGVNSIFAGPAAELTFGQNLSLRAGIELPLFVDNTDLQLVPDYRFRLSASYSF